MKNITLIAMLVLLLGCAGEKKENKENNAETIENKEAVENTKTETKAETRPDTDLVVDFLNDVRNLESEDSQNPIASFQEAAERVASKTMAVNKENMEAFLTEAKKYKHCVIITEDHTIVKINDPENCKPSGSWGACMPYAEGYIKKGALEFQEDYINYIIGLPDEQQRMGYLFN